MLNYEEIMKILCGIVLFNANVDLLIQSLASISKQVKKIVLIDNKSTNLNVVKQEVEKRFDNIDFIFNEDNYGTAFAYNTLIKYAKGDFYEWFLILDQDTICPENLIAEYSNYIDEDTCIITPNIKYINASKEVRSCNEIDYIDYCIASGALINTKIANDIGGFDDYLFLDYVDFEFCIRVRKKGFKIIRCNNVKIMHSLGNLKEKRFLNYYINITNHSIERRYYYAYNICYVSRKHPDKISKVSLMKKLIGKSIIISLFEERRWDKIKAIIHGYMDSKKGKTPRHITCMEKS